MVLYFVLQLFNRLGVVRVLLSAHLVDKDSKGPNVRRLCLMFLLPELRGQVVWRTHFLEFVFFFTGHIFVLSLLADALKTLTVSCG